MIENTKVASKLLRSKTYILITPKEAIMSGEVPDTLNGVLQIQSLYQMRDKLDELIKEWEGDFFGGKSNRRTKSRKNK